MTIIRTSKCSAVNEIEPCRDSPQGCAVGRRDFLKAATALTGAASLFVLDTQMVDRGFTPHYDYALQGLRDVPYDAWRTYDPESALRFYALRLQEVGMLKATPQRIIAQATDWRFLNELKKELKA